MNVACTSASIETYFQKTIKYQIQKYEHSGQGLKVRISMPPRVKYDNMDQTSHQPFLQLIYFHSNQSLTFGHEMERWSFPPPQTSNLPQATIVPITNSCSSRKNCAFPC